MIIFYARNQTMFSNRTFYDKEEARKYVGKNGYIEKFELRDDDYFYLTDIDKVGNGGDHFGLLLCAKEPINKKTQIGTQKIWKYSFENIIGMPENFTQGITQKDKPTKKQVNIKAKSKRKRK